MGKLARWSAIATIAVASATLLKDGAVVWAWLTRAAEGTVAIVTGLRGDSIAEEPADPRVIVDPPSTSVGVMPPVNDREQVADVQGPDVLPVQLRLRAAEQRVLPAWRLGFKRTTRRGEPHGAPPAVKASA